METLRIKLRSFVDVFIKNINFFSFCFFLLGGLFHYLNVLFERKNTDAIKLKNSIKGLEFLVEEQTGLILRQQEHINYLHQVLADKTGSINNPVILQYCIVGGVIVFSIVGLVWYFFGKGNPNPDNNSSVVNNSSDHIVFAVDSIVQSAKEDLTNISDTTKSHQDEFVTSMGERAEEVITQNDELGNNLEEINNITLLMLKLLRDDVIS